jgi:predicted phosphate transport protein (TIGR00153 family)
MPKKKDNEYYIGFVECVGFSCKAAAMLKESLTDFKPDKLGDTMNALHAVEHSADAKKHELMKKLVKEFITPIEREDIMALCDNIDDVTDAIDDVLMRIYMNNITRIRDDVLPFTDLIIKCCDTLKSIMDEFPNFKKSETLMKHIISLNTLEEEGDRLYMTAMRRLHTQSNDPIEIIAWREVYEFLEKCCDACEHAADVVESVVMKNT